LVICERDKRNDNIITKIFSNAFYFILKKTIFKNYPKNGFDVFMINKKLLSNLNLNTHSPTISLMIYSLGFKYKKIFYDRKKREHGKSQWTFSKKLNLF
jgi:dolichol-phosphate mannosyltransferase